jgi:hypothetical protein
MERPKIELYQVRSFSDKLSAVFAFFGENYKVLLKYLTYFLLPLSLLQSVALDGYFSGVMTMSKTGSEVGDNLVNLVGSMGAMIVLYVIGTMVMLVIVYALMRLYGKRENRLLQLTWDELKPEVMLLSRRCLILMLVSVLLAVVTGLVMFAFAAVHIALIVVPLLAVMVVCIPLSLLYPIYFFEDDISITAAIGKSFHLGFPTWGGIFGVMLVLSLLGSFVSGTIGLPWTVLTTMKAVLGDDGGNYEFVNSVGYSFLVYILGVVQAFVNYFAYSLPYIGLAYHYGHASEKIDHVTMESDIDRFEQL